jgi:LmbE family N-acetylglucosaminyl deacetylase
MNPIYSTSPRPCTHMAIGTHPDDIELVGMHGILECYESATNSFAGVVVADGAGSARSGAYANVTDEEMVKIRIHEQTKAAQIGKYAFQAQLVYPSSVIKQLPEKLIQHLYDLLVTVQPKFLYLHNPLDRHTSHLAVLHACIEALRRLPNHLRPAKCYGVEVWRSLDFLPTHLRVMLPTDQVTGLPQRLIEVFESQIAGGKNYALGFIGRGLANATFSESHQVDVFKSASFAVDLLPLIQHTQLTIKEFALQMVEAVKMDIEL